MRLAVLLLARWCTHHAMYESQKEIQLLLQRVRRGRVEEPASWVTDPPEARARVEAAPSRENRMELYFAEPPSAADLGNALILVDREARRVARALEERVPPSSIRGEARRFGPTHRGLVVESARAGSLDVAVQLGGIYEAVVSQPLSFVLNVASLLQYSRLVVRSFIPSGSSSEEVLEVPTEHGPVKVPQSMNRFRLKIVNSDGSRIEFDGER